MNSTQNIELTPVAIRFLEFVEAQGGASEVAKKLDTHPQLIYNIQKGKSKPSHDTWEKLARAYPGKVDMNYMILGVRSGASAPAVVALPTSGAGGDVELLRQELEKSRARERQLEGRNVKLMDRIEQLTDALLEKAGLELRNFLQAVSESPMPTGDRVKVQGFRVGDARRSISAALYDIHPSPQIGMS